MNDLIFTYIEETYSPEMKSLISRSFGIFEVFENYSAFPKLEELVLQHQNIENDDLSIKFIEEIKGTLITLAESHGLNVAKDLALSKYVELMTALAIIQRLEDYEPLARKLEGTKSDLETVCDILEAVSTISAYEYMEMIEEITPVFMTGLRDFIAGKELEIEASREELAVFKMDSVRFFEKKFGRDSVGIKFLLAGVSPGLPYSSYFSLSKGHIYIQGDIKATALNFYSLMIISSDAHISPITFFRKEAPALIEDVNTIMEVEKAMLLIASEHDSYRRAFEGKV